MSFKQIDCILAMKTAIFCLTRGYQNPAMYSRLVTRNMSIRKLIGTGSDMILFHEGNISRGHQQLVESKTPELKIKWVEVPFRFPTDVPLPHETLVTFYDGSCYPGYHLMCEFHTCDVWDHLKDYDVVLRVDEDCILQGDWSNVFNEVSEEIPYRTPMFDVEIHALTNKTLPEWLGKDAVFYDESMPYTNVFVSRMDILRRPDIRAWTESVRASRGCIKYRWGDAPIHGIILKKFGIGHGIMEGYDYYHGSHNRHVSSTKSEHVQS